MEREVDHLDATSVGGVDAVRATFDSVVGHAEEARIFETAKMEGIKVKSMEVESATEEEESEGEGEGGFAALFASLPSARKRRRKRTPAAKPLPPAKLGALIDDLKKKGYDEDGVLRAECE